MAFKRKRIGRRKSKKMFSKTARRVHKRNLPRNPMRGGHRM